MAKRLRIGLNFFFDNKSNSGIVNYIYNIVSALNTLKITTKPKLLIFYSLNAPINFIKEINYPYIKFILFKPYSSNIFIRKTNSFIRRITKQDLFINWNYFNKIDSLFPFFDFSDKTFRYFKKKIHWLVDFNNRAFPNHYKDCGEQMNDYQKKIVFSRDRVVISSNFLLEELKNYYPDYTCDIQVLQFASSINVKEDPKIFEKYKLKEELYFISPNQFWEHKNQKLVLEALSLVKKLNPALKFKVIFTGSLDVNRGNGQYIEQLKTLVVNLNIQNYVEFLGVIEREDQIFLMKHAIAIIQPSMYEGWSTLVEEAKALNKFIILSDLPVHREQITKNVSFFEPLNAVILANKMINQLIEPQEIILDDYKKNIEKFGKDIIRILSFSKN